MNILEKEDFRWMSNVHWKIYQMIKRSWCACFIRKFIQILHRISDSLLFGECFSVVCTVRAVDRYLLKYEFSQNYLRFISSCLPHETLADFSLMNPTTPKKTSFDVDFGRVISLAICFSNLLSRFWIWLYLMR